MNSDTIKEDIIQKVQQACIPWATRDQIDTVCHALTIALYDIHLSKEERALSTDVRMTNYDYLKNFVAIKMVKGLSPKTIVLYKGTINKFFSIVDKPVAKVTANEIRYYLAIRKTRDNVSEVTLNNELLHLRSFFSTLNNEEIIPRNPTAKIDAIKCGKRVKEPFTELEVEMLRTEVQKMPPHHGSHFNIKRNVAIFEVFCSTGCRIGELINIKKSDVNGDRVKVIGKGNKERIVYLNPRAQIAIKNYLESRTDTFAWLFPGGEFAVQGAVVDRPISATTIEGMFRRLGKRAGIKNVHPHRFRRTAATFALRRGMPIEQVSKMLGHEQIATTQIYAITSDDDVAASHRKYLA